jgi:hypothetical protein
LLAIGAVLPWELQKTATLGLVSPVSTYHPLPSRFVVLGFALIALGYRRMWPRSRGDAALVAATAVAAVAVPGLHLVTTNASRATPALGGGFYMASFVVFAWVALATAKLQTTRSELGRAAIVVTEIVGLVGLAVVYHESHTSLAALYAPNVGFYATAVAAAPLGAAAALASVQARPAAE